MVFLVCSLLSTKPKRACLEVQQEDVLERVMGYAFKLYILGDYYLSSFSR